MIRRKALNGDLPVPLEEKIEILIFLSGEKDEAVRHQAFHKLVGWDRKELQDLLADGATPWSVIDYLVSYIVPGQKDLVEAFLRNPGVPPDLADWIKMAPARPSDAPPPPPSAEILTDEEGDKEKKDPDRQTLLQRINSMTPAEKIKTALTGNQEERLVLIRDSNKLVARAVLGSPKLTDAEVDSFASMKNVTEEVLRHIAMNRAFMKRYSVAVSLLNNPRTPLDVGLPLLNRMNERDLKALSINKNIAETLRGLATKLYKQKKEPPKQNLPGKH